MRQEPALNGEAGDFLFKLGAFLRGQRASGVAILRSTIGEIEQLRDIFKAEAKLLGALDEADGIDGSGSVVAVPGGKAVRLGQEATPLIVAESLDVNVYCGREFCASHAITISPVPKYRSSACEATAEVRAR